MIFAYKSNIYLNVKCCNTHQCLFLDYSVFSFSPYHNKFYIYIGLQNNFSYLKKKWNGDEVGHC